jgi:hypothetical protein
MNLGLHVTTDFLVIKRWIELRKGIPAAITVEGKKIPAVGFGDIDCPGWEQVPWEDFFDMMLEHELAFAFEEYLEDDCYAQYFKFVPWQKFPDELKVSQKQPESMMIAQTVFS